MLKTRLKQLANSVDIDGFESLLDLSSETFLDLETLLNEKINTATDKGLQHYAQLRFLFRILLKYGRDMQQGLNQLTKYEDNG